MIDSCERLDTQFMGNIRNRSCGRYFAHQRKWQLTQRYRLCLNVHISVHTMFVQGLFVYISFVLKSCTYKDHTHTQASIEEENGRFRT